MKLNLLVKLSYLNSNFELTLGYLNQERFSVVLTHPLNNSAPDATSGNTMRTFMFPNVVHKRVDGLNLIKIKS